MAKNKKPETWWCIKSGKILLPFTSMGTKRAALNRRLDFLLFAGIIKDVSYRLPDYESCVKIEVREI